MVEVILCAVVLLGAGIINLMMRKLSIGLFDAFWALVIFICRNELCRDNYVQCFGLILLMILSVNVGFWLGSHRYRFTFLKKRQEVKRRFSTKIMVLLLQITAVIFIYYAIQSIRKFGFDLLIVRAKNNSDSSEKVFSGLIDTILFYGIGVPLTYVGALVCAYNFSQQIKTPRKIYLLLTVNVLLYVITAGGRSLLLRVVIFFVAAAIWRLKSANRIQLKGLKYCVLGIVALLIVMEIITKSRNASDISFLEQATIYVRGSIAHMQYQLDRIPEKGSYFGYITYGGFLYYPVKLLSQIFGFEWKTSSEIMSFLQTYKYIQLDDTRTYFNAIVPNVFYYYFDSGYWGVILFSAMLGFAASKGERAHKWPTFMNFVLWATAIYAIIYSPLDSTMWTFKYPMALIYCFLLRNILYRKVDTNGTLDQCDRTSL